MLLHAAGSVNVPFRLDKASTHPQYVQEIAQLAAGHRTGVGHVEQDGDNALSSSGDIQPICVICRRGNDSQEVVKLLNADGLLHAFDMVGGLESWAAEVDDEFPVY